MTCVRVLANGLQPTKRGLHSNHIAMPLSGDRRNACGLDCWSQLLQDCPRCLGASTAGVECHAFSALCVAWLKAKFIDVRLVSDALVPSSFLLLLVWHLLLLVRHLLLLAWHLLLLHSNLSPFFDTGWT